MRIPLLSSRRTVAGRLITFSVLYAAAALLIASLVLWFIVAAVVREQVDQRLDMQVDAVKSALSVNADGSLALAGNLDGPPFDRLGSGWYWQARVGEHRIASRSLADGSVSDPPRPFDWRRILTGDPQPAEGSSDRGQALHFRVGQVFVGGVSVEVLAAAPRHALTAPALRALSYLIPAMVVLGCCLVVGIVLQVRYGLAPLRTLSGQLSEISAGRRRDLSPAEVEDLDPVVNDINRLLDDNRARLQETRLQFANLAHGLKTPVASLYLALDDKNDPGREARQLVERIDRKIRHHLGSARAVAAGGGLGFETEVRPRVNDLLQVMSAIYVDRKLAVANGVIDDLVVNCSPEDVDEVMGAIIDNAFKWAATSIVVKGVREGKMLLLTVEDDGPGIDAGRLAEAVSPGVRLDETVPGHGFGLSIAQELVGLFGGKLHLKQREGGGLAATVAFPLSITLP